VSYLVGIFSRRHVIKHTATKMLIEATMTGTKIAEFNLFAPESVVSAGLALDVPFAEEDVVTVAVELG